MPLPTKSENPDGLHQRYIVVNADGTPVPHDAIFFVLRLDNAAKNTVNVAACRSAAKEWISHIRKSSNQILLKVADDLESLIQQLELHGSLAGSVAGSVDDDSPLTLRDKAFFNGLKNL